MEGFERGVGGVTECSWMWWGASEVDVRQEKEWQSRQLVDFSMSSLNHMARIDVVSKGSSITRLGSLLISFTIVFYTVEGRDRAQVAHSFERLVRDINPEIKTPGVCTHLGLE